MHQTYGLACLIHFYLVAESDHYLVPSRPYIMYRFLQGCNVSWPPLWSTVIAGQHRVTGRVQPGAAVGLTLLLTAQQQGLPPRPQEGEPGHPPLLQVLRRLFELRSLRRAISSLMHRPPHILLECRQLQLRLLCNVLAVDRHPGHQDSLPIVLHGSWGLGLGRAHHRRRCRFRRECCPPTTSRKRESSCIGHKCDLHVMAGVAMMQPCLELSTST